MLDRGHGAIINVASTAAFQPNPYGAAYGATKAYLLNLTQAVHEEIRGSGVQLMALCPGFTTTEFQDVASIGAELPDLVVQRADEVVSSALRALGRGRPVHVSGLANKLVALGSTATPTVLTRKLSGLLHRSASR
jgi:short-subunit dehydrogenase